MDRRAVLSAGVALGALAATARFATAQTNIEARPMTAPTTAPTTAAPTDAIDFRKLTDAEWRKRLTPVQYDILRKHGTERAGTSPLNQEKRKGIYACAGCDLPLFDSATKFESGTGWPSFYEPLPNAVGTKTDRSFFMTRTEVHCIRCLGHQGHVFNDGPKPTGLRYCMNGVAMKFVPADGQG
ncbi:MAG: peptide-methionine (R)-S-oxide reductase MsrB [Bradyrhizobium sp.]|nr:peptide-methionine (R)-S-oxide reductase MsrB [Bradyrhizobium sp.]